MKVSILIPLYNSEKYIAETITSCLNQKYKDIEVIVVDDGSTDNSLQEAKKFESNQVKIFSKENKGACAARNFAFTQSTGDYIQYLDADDVLDPEKISSQMNLVSEFGNIVVYSGKWGKFVQYLNEVIWEEQKINRDYNNPVNWLIDSWNGEGMGQTSIWLIPRNIILKAGQWNESLKINQDGEFFSRVLLSSKAIKYIDKSKVFYRFGNNSSISQKDNHSKLKAASLLKSYILYHKNCSQYLHSKNLKEALGQNYLNFIYRFYPLYPSLIKTAEENFYKLGYNKMWSVGGVVFKKLSILIGFKNALKLKTLLKKS
jgi:glycosyltransferase involved in cell wall biosynthesis